MCERRAGADDHAPVAREAIGRRGVLGMIAATIPAFAIARYVPAAQAAGSPKPENMVSPDAALERLMKGNARYVDGIARRHDFKHEREALSKGQNPFAAVLSCADSRIAPEYCFDTARGDVFVCRVAGNFANDDIVASFEYAVEALNTPVILVLGHESCGAIAATIKSLKEGATLPGHLPALVTALAPAVRAAQGAPGDLLANAVARNVMLNVDRLRNSSPILRSFVDDKKVRVVGGVYHLASGRVELLS